MKLIMQKIHVGQECKLCEKIGNKKRRRAAEVSRIERWSRDIDEFRVSIERSMDTIKNLDSDIHELAKERNRRSVRCPF
jgi:hypothetical protein